MNKNHPKYKHLAVFISLLIIGFEVFSQTINSELALTGRGGLVLVGKDYKLQKEVYDEFKKMQHEALKDGISIQIVSAYRSYNRQKNIWNRKYKKYISKGMSPQQAIEKVVEYSTIPGTSRHHWGTDIDIIDGFVKKPKHLLVEGNYENNGVFSKLKSWMDSNAEKFGFYLVYDNNKNRKGFKYEPWHYTYKQLSKPMLKEFLEIDLIHFFQASNLKGSQLLSEEFLKKYFSENILDINSNLK